MPIGTALLAATQAYSLAKQGIALYKDIKNTAGDVKGILNDFNKQFAGKKVSKEQAQQIEQERERVKEIGAADPHDVMGQIGDHLGAFFDAFDAIEALFWKEERAAKQVYKGDMSVSRRALRRVLIRTRLQQMHAEIRTEMTWNAPIELGDLWTQFQNMREQVIKEQEVALLAQEKQEKIDAARAVEVRRRQIERIKYHVSWVSGVLFVVVYLHVLTYLIEQDRFWRWGQ
ncbi:hypothetical protein UFOVP33_55 [uncultured Caudovirales phage]|uniref:Uncharacterized protein n=1 Tax=uncultured Caudovirales phage TaxID=2100421 RepID=A0A6J5KRC1_9CAUD|nr:hypothetical protein UFOVP33_55 [uncultured Caudovirales phage]